MWGEITRSMSAEFTTQGSRDIDKREIHEWREASNKSTGDKLNTKEIPDLTEIEAVWRRHS